MKLCPMNFTNTEFSDDSLAHPGRRRFLAAGGAASVAVLQSSVVFGDEANSKIRIGIVGCGSRGAWLADLFAADGRFHVAGAADYFQDRVDAVGEKHNLDASRRFTGLTCHRNMIGAGGLDAVAIVSPPYFHPEQATAAVDAGLHVWLAKPAAVDVAGCRIVEAAGATATKNKLTFLIDFQTRATAPFIEAMRRVHGGAIGDVVFGESTYHAERLPVKSEEKSAEGRLRNWVFEKDYSGDIITEQNIHTLDVMSWTMKEKPPEAASGTGGRKVRVDVGDCWDNFSLVYDYGNGVGVTFSSRQFAGHGSSPSGILNRMFGTEGVLETSYGGMVLIRGKNFYKGGRTPGIYKEGVVSNIASFADSIIGGEPSNPTTAPGIQSNLVTILGRAAAYEKRTVTWEELMKANSRIEADLTGLKV